MELICHKKTIFGSEKWKGGGDWRNVRMVFKQMFYRSNLLLCQDRIQKCSLLDLLLLQMSCRPDCACVFYIYLRFISLKGFGACSRAHLPPSPHSSSAQVKSRHDRFSFYLVLNMSALGLGQVMTGFPISCTQYVSDKVRSRHDRSSFVLYSICQH